MERGRGQGGRGRGQGGGGRDGAGEGGSHKGELPQLAQHILIPWEEGDGRWDEGEWGHAHTRTLVLRAVHHHPQRRLQVHMRT